MYLILLDALASIAYSGSFSASKGAQAGKVTRNGTYIPFLVTLVLSQA